jgi:hypothetical protein
METTPTQPYSTSSSDNRFARFTAENHSAPIWISTLLSLIFAICILAVRLGFVKWNARGLDDVVLTLAHVCPYTKLYDGVEPADYRVDCGSGDVGHIVLFT